MTAKTLRAAFASRVGAFMEIAAAIGGAGLITSGVWMIDRPVAFIVAGLFLLAGAWLSARKAAD